MVTVKYDPRAKKIVEKLDDLNFARVIGYVDLFKINQFRLPSKDLKKLSDNLWELRPGNIRLLFGQVGQDFIIVNVFKKQTQKTPSKEILTAKSRLREYLR